MIWFETEPFFAARETSELTLNYGFTNISSQPNVTWF